MTELPQTAAVPTRMTRALMKTFRLIPSQKLVKSSIQNTRAVARETMQKWEMRTVMLLPLLLPLIPQYLNARRRSRRLRNEQPTRYLRMR
jgi:hypothetical protein